jgi:hypothetical protein
MRPFVLVPLVSFVVLAVGAACSSTPEAEDPSMAANNPCPPGQFCPQTTPTPTMTNTAPMPTTTGTAPAPTGGGATCSPIAAGAMATPLLMPLQQQHAPGMQPEGSAAAGQCGEGQTFEIAFTMQPGKCYSAIAVGMGVQELDAMIAAQPMPNLPPAPLAQDSGSGAQAIVAGGGSCYKNFLPVPAPAKLIVKATRGQGAAVAQLYVK